MHAATARTRGAHHVGRTVPDLGAARGFLIHDRGFTQGREKPDHPAEFVSHGEVMFTLWRAEDPASAIAFDRRHGICLHHLALQVASASALDAPHDDLARREYWAEQMQLGYDLVEVVLPFVVNECGEGFGSIPDAAENAGVEMAFSTSKIAGDLDRVFYMRTGLLADLVQVGRDSANAGSYWPRFPHRTQP